VGAPRAQSGQPGTNHSGVVFKCSLTTYKNDCVQLKIEQDNKRKTFKECNQFAQLSAIFRIEKLFHF